MGLEEYTVRVTKHALQQYEARVEPIEIERLRELLTEQVASGDYTRKREYIKLDGVWWVYELVSQVMIMITCYGRTHVDIPSALRWAKLHKDRIDLSRGSEVLCDASE